MNDDSIATHMYCHVLSVLLTGQKKKKKKIYIYIYIYIYKRNIQENHLDSYQDGAEDGSRVASSEKTLQVFVCFVCFTC